MKVLTIGPSDVNYHLHPTVNNDRGVVIECAAGGCMTSFMSPTACCKTTTLLEHAWQMGTDSLHFIPGFLVSCTNNYVKTLGRLQTADLIRVIVWYNHVKTLGRLQTANLRVVFWYNHVKTLGRLQTANLNL